MKNRKKEQPNQNSLNDQIGGLQTTEPSSTDEKSLIPPRTKYLIAFLAFLCFLLYRLIFKKHVGPECNIDKYHQITYEANRKLYYGWDNTIIGIGQLLMDGWVIFMSLYWFCNVKNMRFPSAIAVYFLFRALLLNLQKFPFPEDIVWHNPGFFSFSVPYQHTRDFYYSGHTGTLSMISMQLFTLKKNTMCVICIVSLIYMVNMLTVTRIHYSIDIVGALIFAPFWFYFVKKHLAKFDWAFSLPFSIGKKIWKKCKRNEYNDQTSQIEIEPRDFVVKEKEQEPTAIEEQLK